jgi:hypothetical protein
LVGVVFLRSGFLVAIAISGVAHKSWRLPGDLWAAFAGGSSAPPATGRGNYQISTIGASGNVPSWAAR